MNSLLRNYLKFFYYLLLLFGLYSLCRILFLLFNYSYFNSVSPINFLGGLQFDWLTISILFGPFFLSYILAKGKSNALSKGLFQLGVLLSVVFNVIDLEYFKFTNKRTTADLFNTSGLENDIGNLILPFLVDYWYLVLIAILLWALSYLFYALIAQLESPSLPWKKWPLIAFPILLFLGIGFRGGIQYKPLDIIHAGKYAAVSNIPLVLNTPFTILKTLSEEELTVYEYFPSDSLDHLYSPIQQYSSSEIPTNKNVVLLIMESFSFEFIGALSGEKTQTPFLDSLIAHSLVFENTFANGKKSIEALPSILAGVPTLMNTSYISSKYSTNRLNGIGTILGNEGYQTLFYHGGENGTMGFNSFAKISGIAEYKGKNEYPYKGHFDGNWGIFDEPYLSYVKEDLSLQKEPFFASIFTLSSHHPFAIPEQYLDRFNKNEEPLLNSINYADYALKKFFNAAQKEDWFENTVFVITADHTSQSFSPKFNNRLGWYRVPLIFFHPPTIKAGVSDRLSQQSDIFPSIIDYLNLNEQVVAFGSSVLDTLSRPYSISYLNNSYQYIEDDYCILFDGDKTNALFLWKEDPAFQNNQMKKYPEKAKQLTKNVKAIIQQYQERVLNNELVP